jgi:aryl-alcohol dehydrogenase-like predicted oxidoreductase
MLTRRLGRSGIEVSAVGAGGWPIGGGRGHYGPVDDRESVAALHQAFDSGVTFFETADMYGFGKSERLFGRAFSDRRPDVVIATKFGGLFDEARQLFWGEDASPEHIVRACEASLQRLNTDYIDLYQLHNHVRLREAAVVRDALEELVTSGKIRAYGWSTDSVEGARVFAEGPHCAAIEHTLNLFDDSAPMLEALEDLGLASINRSPLAMGLLTGKYGAHPTFAEDDIRVVGTWVPYFKEEQLPAFLAALHAVRDVLTRDGRSLAQGALGWILARSRVAIPIPGFKTVAQAKENAETLRWGPLSEDQMAEIRARLATNALAAVRSDA